MVRTVQVYICLGSLLSFLDVSSQGIQTNPITGQITNLEQAKSQKIIDEVRFYEPEGNCPSSLQQNQRKPFLER